jgi:hypothetical protein
MKKVEVVGTRSTNERDETITVLVEKQVGKRPLVRHVLKSEGNIKMDL